MKARAKTRGMTLPEVIVGSFITVLVLGTGASGTMFCAKVTRKAADTSTATASLSRAQQAISKDVSAAQSVLASSRSVGIALDHSDKRLVLALPCTNSLGVADLGKVQVVSYQLEGSGDATRLVRTAARVDLGTNAVTNQESTCFLRVIDVSFACFTTAANFGTVPLASADPLVPTASDKLRSEAAVIAPGLRAVIPTKILTSSVSDSVDFVSFVVECRPSPSAPTLTASGGCRVGGK